jgi:hypothetical protein
MVSLETIMKRLETCLTSTSPLNTRGRTTTRLKPLTVALIAALVGLGGLPVGASAQSAYWQDTRDGGNDPMVSGCHLGYPNDQCKPGEENGEYGDKCETGLMVPRVLTEWTDKQCHPTEPFDNQLHNCDQLCFQQENKKGKCVTEVIDCNNKKINSAKCVCFDGGGAGDVNNDGEVTVDDVTFTLEQEEKCQGDSGYDAAADLNGDGCVDEIDLDLITLSVPIDTDVTGDGEVDAEDLATVLAQVRRCSGEPHLNPAADLNGDGCVTELDLRLISLSLPIIIDVTGDGRTDKLDLALFVTQLGKCSGDLDFNPAADFDGDSCVAAADVSVVGFSMPPPTIGSTGEIETDVVDPNPALAQ